MNSHSETPGFRCAASGLRTVIPSQWAESKKDFLPEFILSSAEGVEMTVKLSLGPLRLRARPPCLLGYARTQLLVDDLL